MPPSPPPSITPKRPAPKVQFDWRDWLPYLDTMDAPEEKKRELIETVWSIVLAFVDMGWEVGSGPETSGKEIDLTAVLTAAVVNLETKQSEEV